MLCSVILQAPHSFHLTKAAHRATVHKAGKWLVQDPWKDLLRLICYQSTGPISWPGCSTATSGRLMDEERACSLQTPSFGRHSFVSKADSWKSSGAAGPENFTPRLRYCDCGLDAAPGENSQQQWNEMRVEPVDFVRNTGKGNDSKSKDKAIILKGPLPAAEVYGVLWLPPGSCGAPASQSRGDSLPSISRWIGNRIRCDDKPVLIYFFQGKATPCPLQLLEYLNRWVNEPKRSSKENCWMSVGRVGLSKEQNCILRRKNSCMFTPPTLCYITALFSVQPLPPTEIILSYVCLLIYYLSSQLDCDLSRNWTLV